MITDPIFYFAAIPAVVIVGISKGGFGGIALLAVPILSLVTDPIKSAAIMLPILITMDVFALWIYRGTYDLPSLTSLLPPAMLGIFVGWLTATWVTADFVRFVIGTISILFTLDHWLKWRPTLTGRPSRIKGLFCGAGAGFTSFIAHAGAPPFQFYMVPIRLEPRIYIGTGVIFFAIVNAIKVLPYTLLGQFDTENLLTSLVLLPLAPLSILLGFTLVKIVSVVLFYRITYFIVFLIGLKLIWDSLAPLVFK